MDDELLEGDSSAEMLVAQRKPDLELMQARREAAKAMWEPIHGDAEADARFIDGADMWDAQIARARQQSGLSCLVYNQLAPKRLYIVNNARSADTGVKCLPIADGAEANTAKVFDGLIRFICRESNAKEAFVHALKGAVTGGVGMVRVIPVKCDDGRVDLRVQRVLNPGALWIDPAAEEVDWTDAQYCFYRYKMARSSAGRIWEDSTLETEKSSKNQTEMVEITEYWCKEGEEDGFRWSQHFYWKDEWLSSDFSYPGKMMPFALVMGEEEVIGDVRKFKGIVRDNKDMQRLLNMSKSLTADYIVRSSIQQWLVRSEQIAGYEKFWLESNVNGVPVLPWVGGPGDAPPVRLPPVEPPVGFQTVSTEADSDLRSAIGIRDTMADLPPNIASETMRIHLTQANIGTFGFHDRRMLMERTVGKILLDLIPAYYDQAEVRQVMGIDGNVSQIPVNQPYEENGQTVAHYLTRGKYSIDVTSGPGYETSQREAIDKIVEMGKVNPAVIQVGADILVRKSQFDGATEIADRLFAGLPPQIQAASNATNGDKAQVAGLMAQVQTLSQQLQQVQGVAQQLQQLNEKLQVDVKAQVAKVHAQARADANQSQLDHQHKVAEIVVEGQVQANLDAQRGHTEIFHRTMDHTLGSSAPGFLP